MFDLPAAPERMTDLQIGLPIQVLGFDVARAVRVRSRQDDYVGRDLIVVVNANKIPNLNILPAVLVESRLSSNRQSRVNEISEVLLPCLSTHLFEGGHMHVVSGARRRDRCHLNIFERGYDRGPPARIRVKRLARRTSLGGILLSEDQPVRSRYEATSSLLGPPPQ